jgi:hypothetical protein
MKLSELESQITDAYHKYFPTSRIYVNYSDKFGATITIGAYIAGDKSENSGKYWDNDVLSLTFSIHGESGQQLPKGLTADSELPTLELTKYHAHYFITPENKNLCYESRSLSFRKVSGEAEKIVIYLDKFFAKFHAQILGDYIAGRIHSNHLAVVKSHVADFQP